MNDSQRGQRRGTNIDDTARKAEGSRAIARQAAELAMYVPTADDEIYAERLARAQAAGPRAVAALVPDIARDIEAPARKLGAAVRAAHALLDTMALAAAREAGEPGASDVRAVWGRSRVNREIAGVLQAAGLGDVLAGNMSGNAAPVNDLEARWSQRASEDTLTTSRTSQTPRPLEFHERQPGTMTDEDAKRLTGNKAAFNVPGPGDYVAKRIAERGQRPGARGKEPLVNLGQPRPLSKISPDEVL